MIRETRRTRAPKQVSVTVFACFTRTCTHFFLTPKPFLPYFFSSYLLLTPSLYIYRVYLLHSYVRTTAVDRHSDKLRQEHVPIFVLRICGFSLITRNLPQINSPERPCLPSARSVQITPERSRSELLSETRAGEGRAADER